MLFPTFNFLLFFIAAFTAGWALFRRDQWRKIFLIGASYFFYAFWDWRFAFLLLGSSLFNYAAGLAIEARESGRGRKWAVGLAVAGNLVVLGFFKYYGFFLESLDEILTALGWRRDLPFLEIILPVGISFFTFQGISYIVDVYRKKIPASRSPVDILLYIGFFPHLVAGPIVRAADFLPQLRRPPDPRHIMVALGVTLILWGLFKKSIVANYLAIDLVDKVFEAPSRYGALDLLLAIYGYAVQIYCDFSAYSDIAIGVAALFGYAFPRNFDQPYRSGSVTEFWRRWHMSLSKWLRDYLYVPLGGNRGGALKTYRNLMLTMLLGGLWHGAAWKFVIWGALHGAALAFERMTQVLRARLGPVFGSRALAIFVVFHFVCFCWIFFRAKNLDVAGEFLAGLANWSEPAQLATMLSLLLIAIGLAVNFTPRDTVQRIEGLVQRMPTVTLGLFAGAALVVIEAFGLDGAAPFIYFQF